MIESHTGNDRGRSRLTSFALNVARFQLSQLLCVQCSESDVTLQVGQRDRIILAQIILNSSQCTKTYALSNPFLFIMPPAALAYLASIIYSLILGRKSSQGTLQFSRTYSSRAQRIASSLSAMIYTKSGQEPHHPWNATLAQSDHTQQSG
jgi:hypothetical protein